MCRIVCKVIIAVLIFAAISMVAFMPAVFFPNWDLKISCPSQSTTSLCAAMQSTQWSLLASPPVPEADLALPGSRAPFPAPSWVPIKKIWPFVQWFVRSWTHAEEKVTAGKVPVYPDPKTWPQLDSLLKGTFPMDDACRDPEKWYFRQNDGSCNWVKQGQYTIGTPEQAFYRGSGYHYADGFNSPRSVHGPYATARNLSNLLYNQDTLGRKTWMHTPFVVGFVEFLVHDISYARSNPQEQIEMPVPPDDPFFGRNCSGIHDKPWWFQRTGAMEGTGTHYGNPRKSMNSATPWADLGHMYGHTDKEVRSLRTLKDGKLKMDGKLLPKTRTDRRGASIFVPDARANQDVLLQSYHLLWSLEHNRLADLLKRKYPHGLRMGPWTDELLFKTARAVNGFKFHLAAESYLKQYYFDRNVDPMQIMYDYLGPEKSSWTLGGFTAYPWEGGLENGVPLPVSDEESIGYQWHDILPGEIYLCNVTEGVNRFCHKKVGMVSSAFQTTTLENWGIESVLSGMASTELPHFHGGIADELRNIPHRYGGIRDLVAWTIERERERGLATYNDWLRTTTSYTKPKIRKNFSDFCGPSVDEQYLCSLLPELYPGGPDTVDLIVGQTLDPLWWPGTYVPMTAVATSLFTVAVTVFQDRFGPGWLASNCVVDQWVTNCTPTNVVQELFWREVTTTAPHWMMTRNMDVFWFDEFDMAHGSDRMLWKLIVQNTNLKCLQYDVFYAVNDTNNKVECYDLRYFPGPKKPITIDPLNTLTHYLELTSEYGAMVHYTTKGDQQEVVLLSDYHEAEEMRTQRFDKPKGKTSDYDARPLDDFARITYDTISAGRLGAFYLSASDNNHAAWTAMHALLNATKTLDYAAWIPMIVREGNRLADALGKESHWSFDPYDELMTHALNTFGSIVFGSQYEINSEVTEAFRYWVTEAGRFVGKSRDSWYGRDEKELQRRLDRIKDFLATLSPVGGVTPEPWAVQMLREAGPALRENALATIFDMYTHSLHSAFTLDYALYLIGSSKDLQEQLHQDILLVGPLTPASLHSNALRLLMKTIKEVNRAAPPAAGGLITRQAQVTSTLAKRLIPKGTHVILNSLLIHHDKHVPAYADEPYSFKPQRWDYQDLAKFMKSSHGSSFLTFGTGVRACSGASFAFVYEAVTLAEILRHNQIHYVWPKSMPPVVEHAFTSTCTLRVRLSKRFDKSSEKKEL